MDSTKIAGHLFQAVGEELALAASVAFVHLELWILCRSVRTGRNTARVLKYIRMLPHILRKLPAELLRHSVFSNEVGRDLGARRCENILASATCRRLPTCKSQRAGMMGVSHNPRCYRDGNTASRRQNKARGNSRTMGRKLWKRGEMGVRYKVGIGRVTGRVDGWFSEIYQRLSRGERGTDGYLED